MYDRSFINRLVGNKYILIQFICTHIDFSCRDGSFQKKQITIRNIDLT